VKVIASPVEVSAAESFVPGTLIGHTPAIPPAGATVEGWVAAAEAA
jgi:hypothetical protein